MTHLHFGAEDDMCVPAVCEAKYATELLHRELADVSDLELWRLGRFARGVRRWIKRRAAEETDLGAHLELNHLDLVCYDGWLGALVEGRVEHLDRVGMKLV